MKKRYEIDLIPDVHGMVGRECPNADCQRYFKIKPGTGSKEITDCYCPYCGYQASEIELITADQKAFGYSIVRRELTESILDELLGRKSKLGRQTRGGLQRLETGHRSSLYPIQYYAEKELETELICEGCGLHFAIFGMFGYCPDCRAHNSYQILNENLELAIKEIDVAQSTDDKDLADFLLPNPLMSAVASFDGFGREVCRVSTPSLEKIRFQNIVQARKRIVETYGFDFADSLTPDEWRQVVICYNKRHLFEHKMGVVDEEYLRNTGDPDAVKGTKVSIESDEIQEFIFYLIKMGEEFAMNLPIDQDDPSSSELRED